MNLALDLSSLGSSKNFEQILKPHEVSKISSRDFNFELLKRLELFTPLRVLNVKIA